MTRPARTDPAADVDVVSKWLASYGDQLDISAVTAPLLPSTLHAAEIVGVALGYRVGHESLYSAHGIIQALFDAGFRALTLEGTTQTAAELNHWVTTGRGEPHAMLAGSQAFLHNAETLELLRRIREHNVALTDDQIQLVHSLKPHPETANNLNQIETQLAETDLRWRERTGHRIVHLGGIAHLVVGDPRKVSPAGAIGRNYGAYVADRTRYACIAVTVGASKDPAALPPPPPQFLEHALTRPVVDGLFIDFASAARGVDAPPEVTRWFEQPLRTRCVGPDYDPGRNSEFFVQAGPVADAIAAVAHVDTITPAQPPPTDGDI